MGSKNVAKPEKKKPAKPRPKAAPRGKHEDISQVAVRIVREATKY